MEQHSHIVLVVSSIEASNVDRRTPKAVTESLGVQGGLPVVGDKICVSFRVGGFDSSDTGGHSIREE